jgi:hypothetical protein
MNGFVCAAAWAARTAARRTWFRVMGVVPCGSTIQVAEDAA